MMQMSGGADEALWKAVKAVDYDSYSRVFDSLELKPVATARGARAECIPLRLLIRSGRRGVRRKFRILGWVFSHQLVADKAYEDGFKWL